MANTPFEIPQTLRDLSEQNLRQAHAAYEQLTGFVTKAMDTFDGRDPRKSHDRSLQGCARPRDGNRDGKCRVCIYVRRQDLQRTNPQDIVTLQTEYAQERMQAFVTQTQQLFSFMGEALPKSERGAVGISMAAMPTNLILQT